MDQPRLDARLAERPLDRPVIGSGHFDRDDRIADIMLLARLFELHRRQLHLHSSMFNLGRRYEHLPVEAAKHPFRPGLGAVDGNDPEPLRPDLLHPWLDNSVGFAESGWTVCAGFARIALCSHSNCLLFWGKRFVPFP